MTRLVAASFLLVVLNSAVLADTEGSIDSVDGQVDGATTWNFTSSGEKLRTNVTCTISVDANATEDYAFKLIITYTNFGTGVEVARAETTRSLSPGQTATDFATSLTYTVPVSGAANYYNVDIVLSSYEPSAGEDTLDNGYDQFANE